MRRVRLEKLSAKKNCPARRSQPSGRCQPCAGGVRGSVSIARAAPRPRHSGSDQAAFDQAMAKTAGCFGHVIPAFALRASYRRNLRGGVDSGSRNKRRMPRKARNQVSLKR
jgi:hypothetical protein